MIFKKIRLCLFLILSIVGVCQYVQAPWIDCTIVGSCHDAISYYEIQTSGAPKRSAMFTGRADCKKSSYGDQLEGKCCQSSDNAKSKTQQNCKKVLQISSALGYRNSAPCGWGLVSDYASCKGSAGTVTAGQ